MILQIISDSDSIVVDILLGLGLTIVGFLITRSISAIDKKLDSLEERIKDLEENANSNNIDTLKELRDLAVKLAELKK